MQICSFGLRQLHERTGNVCEQAPHPRTKASRHFFWEKNHLSPLPICSLQTLLESLRTKVEHPDILQHHHSGETSAKLTKTFFILLRSAGLAWPTIFFHPCTPNQSRRFKRCVVIKQCLQVSQDSFEQVKNSHYVTWYSWVSYCAKSLRYLTTMRTATAKFCARNFFQNTTFATKCNASLLFQLLAAFTLPRTGLQHGLSLDGTTFIFDNRHTGWHVTSVCNIIFECCKFLSCVKIFFQLTVQWRFVFLKTTQ